MVIGVALALLAGTAGAQASASAAETDAPPAAIKTLVENCDAHKFETVITATVNGQLKHSKVKMCGTEGQTDADWLRTLRDAIDKTAANPQMPQAVKDQIVTAVKLEITRLGGTLRSSNPPELLAIPNADVTKLAPPPRPVLRREAPLASDYTALPPLAAAAPPPPRLITPGGAPLARPKLSFQCYNSADVAEGPCTAFERGTLVTVQAGENLPSGTSVRFVRGDAKADVTVAGLARGKSMRFELPSDVCAGVGGGTIEVEIVRTDGSAAAEQVVGSDGPYNLRC